ncbi:hypothetical protein [Microbacterium dauci]|uniref:Uncharacterized protein n=1 Tax=Microbacterium dauci TaxID=3048008 RepID=A0ABT6ZCQ8_9MICO|nr:hypothetical protein [Microbacterium sp. LX3-4]MDJ1113791.1 hypothetical protein [Microbacterium sp. LX3-4]
MNVYVDHNLVPREVIVSHGCEIHAYYEPPGSAAGWWSVHLTDTPDAPVYYELAPAGGAE